MVDLAKRPLVAPATPPALFDRANCLLNSANVREPQEVPGIRVRRHWWEQTGRTGRASGSDCLARLPSRLCSSASRRKAEARNALTPASTQGWGSPSPFQHGGEVRLAGGRAPETTGILAASWPSRRGLLALRQIGQKAPYSVAFLDKQAKIVPQIIPQTISSSKAIANGRLPI
jgi:hypothetical protein